MDDDRVFRALADPTRRALLDHLHRRDGRTLGELEGRFDMTRFGVMKHLRSLEGAGLVVTRRAGREKLHYLNPVPIRSIHDRWIDKYTAPRAAALAALKTELEGEIVTEVETATRPQQVYEVFIRAGAERIWEAITNGDFTRRYFYGTRVDSDLAVGSPFVYRSGDGDEAIVEGEVVEADEPRRLVHTWHMLYDAELRDDPPSRVTWEIEPMEDGVCKLTVVHGGFDAETPTYREVAGGWNWVLDGLKTLLETGEPLGAR
jgi:uncharacterized protein YndB with AHSA1/START domain